ncbi:unnamed protein product [Laminaria digitata]
MADTSHVASPPAALAQESSTAAAAKDVVSSIFGSAACVYTGQPLDTIKVRMQARPEMFSGVFQCLRKTLAEESITSLWKGSTPALSGAVVENMVAFSVNQQLKRFFPDKNGVVAPWWQPIAFGGATGIFTSIVLCPSDVIKCKVQVGRSLRGAAAASATATTAGAGVGAVGGAVGAAAGAAGAAVKGVAEGAASAKAKVGLPVLNAAQMTRHVLRTQGIRGLFVGMGAQFSRDVPFYASFFGTYETVVDGGKALPYDIPHELLYFFAGGMAGVVGWAVVMPMDSAKSIIQTAEKPQSILKTVQMVNATKGWRALYAGLTAALVRAFPANAALFLGYEIVRRSL